MGDAPPNRCRVCSIDGTPFWLTASGERRALVIVGGGAGGVELAMAMKSKLRERGSITLVHQGETLLPTHNPKARSLLSAALERHQVAVVTGQAVTAVHRDRVVLADGRELRATIPSG